MPRKQLLQSRIPKFGLFPPSARGKCLPSGFRLFNRRQVTKSLSEKIFEPTGGYIVFIILSLFHLFPPFRSFHYVKSVKLSKYVSSPYPDLFPTVLQLADRSVSPNNKVSKWYASVPTDCKQSFPLAATVPHAADIRYSHPSGHLT